MKLRLESDFRDYYDHMFDRDGDPFKRASRTDLHRRDAFDILAAAGYKVLPHGTAQSMRKTFVTLIGQTVVAYDDPYAHRGEGKRLAKLNTLDDDLYCSFYLRPRSTPISYRDLWIGQMWIGLCICSDDPWRSNVGNVSVISMGMSVDLERPESFKKYPLVAVDLLPNPETGGMEDGYAIDFNTAPGLGGDIRDLIPAKDVVQWIKDFYSRK